MVRHSLLIAAVLATAATALAAPHPAIDQPRFTSSNITVIEKNGAFPALGPLVVEQCAVEDCSDVQP